MRKGVVAAFRLSAAAVVDSRRGRSGLRLNRLGRTLEMDLIPRWETWLRLSPGARKDGGSCWQRSIISLDILLHGCVSFTPSDMYHSRR